MTDSWTFLKKFTHARIALGRIGNSLPTKALLEFRMAHSKARDSVWTELDAQKLPRDLVFIQSKCRTKKEFLLHPDWGKELDTDSRVKLEKLAKGTGAPDCILILADGLSAEALHQTGPNFLTDFLLEIKKARLKVGPVLLARFARVALGDEVASIFKSRSVLMLIGERPGLTSADSLSIYFTFEPRVGKTDAERNCISNIHRQGLSPIGASKMSVYLLQQALIQRLSGLDLKLEYPSEYQRILTP